MVLADDEPDLQLKRLEPGCVVGWAAIGSGRVATRLKPGLLELRGDIVGRAFELRRAVVAALHLVRRQKPDVRDQAVGLDIRRESCG